jgi:hypothetical protein
MEFEKDTPTSDEDRRLAEAKKLTLAPLHTDVAPEGEPDAAVVARHLTEGALANAPNDTEQDQTHVKPSSGLLDDPKTQSSTVKRGKIIVIIVTLLVIIGIIVTAIGISLQL